MPDRLPPEHPRRLQELTATRALTTGVSLNGARPEEYLDRRGAAAYLGVSVRTVDRAIADGRLEAGRVGRLVRIARSACDAMIRSHFVLMLLLVVVALVVLASACGEDPCGVHVILRHFDLDADHPAHVHALAPPPL